MARTRCTQCGKWGADRCVCFSVKDSAKTTKHDSSRNNRDGQAAKKRAARKSIKKGHAVKTDVCDDKNGSTLAADQNRQLELKLQLARARLMQQRLEIQTKEKKEARKQKKRDEDHARNTGYYGRWWWHRNNGNRWWRSKNHHPKDDQSKTRGKVIRPNEKRHVIDDQFNAPDEEYLSVDNDGMN